MHKGAQKGVQIGHGAQAGLVGCLWVHACQTGLIAMGLVEKRVGGTQGTQGGVQAIDWGQVGKNRCVHACES